MRCVAELTASTQNSNRPSSTLRTALADRNQQALRAKPRFLSPRNKEPCHQFPFRHTTFPSSPAPSTHATSLFFLLQPPPSIHHHPSPRTNERHAVLRKIRRLAAPVGPPPPSPPLHSPYPPLPLNPSSQPKKLTPTPPRPKSQPATTSNPPAASPNPPSPTPPNNNNKNQNQQQHKTTNPRAATSCSRPTTRPAASR